MRDTANREASRRRSAPAVRILTARPAVDRDRGETGICPYCLGPWVAAALVGGLVVAPRQTRAVASTFAAVSVSDALSISYARAKPG